jgi:PKD repeat protein
MKSIQESPVAGARGGPGAPAGASIPREAPNSSRRGSLELCVLLAAIAVTAGPVASEPEAEVEQAANANRLPEAAFRYTLAGLAIEVDASRSEDADGVIVEYRWSFGDGEMGQGVTASHTYSRPGTYTVALTVTDDRGAMVGKDYVIAPRAVNQAPTARFSHWAKGLEVGVDASGSSDPEGLVVEFDWDFGDGETARGVRASHTYEKGGSYAIRLTVADDPGATGTVSEVVSVANPPSSSRP